MICFRFFLFLFLYYIPLGNNKQMKIGLYSDIRNTNRDEIRV